MELVHIMSCRRSRNVGWNWFRSCRVVSVEMSNGTGSDPVVIIGVEMSDGTGSDRVVL